MFGAAPMTPRAAVIQGPLVEIASLKTSNSNLRAARQQTPPSHTRLLSKAGSISPIPIIRNKNALVPHRLARVFALAWRGVDGLFRVRLVQGDVAKLKRTNEPKLQIAVPW